MLGMMTPIEYLQSLTGFEHATVNTSVQDVWWVDTSCA
jgi:hypothetical protein